MATCGAGQPLPRQPDGTLIVFPGNVWSVSVYSLQVIFNLTDDSECL